MTRSWIPVLPGTLLFAGTASATDVSGTIGTTRTWTKANSPYRVKAAVTVSVGVTLTVELYGGVAVKSSVVWGDAPNEVEDASGTSADIAVSYSDIQRASGVWSGTRNINADPLLVDPANSDHGLHPGSPAIGVVIPLPGYPVSLSSADMGAIPFGRPTIPTPAAFTLEQNAPNPFNPSMTIRFTLPEASHAELAIYGVNGQLVRRLVRGALQPGRYRVVWDGRNEVGREVSSGLYV